MGSYEPDGTMLLREAGYLNGRKLAVYASLKRKSCSTEALSVAA